MCAVRHVWGLLGLSGGFCLKRDGFFTLWKLLFSTLGAIFALLGVFTTVGKPKMVTERGKKRRRRLMILNLIEVILTDLPSSHWHEKISIDPRALAGRHKILGS